MNDRIKGIAVKDVEADEIWASSNSKIAFADGGVIPATQNYPTIRLGSR